MQETRVGFLDNPSLQSGRYQERDQGSRLRLGLVRPVKTQSCNGNCDKHNNHGPCSGLQPTSWHYDYSWGKPPAGSREESERSSIWAKDKLCLGASNVHTLFETSKTGQATNEMRRYRLDILGWIVNAAGLRWMPSDEQWLNYPALWAWWSTHMWCG